MKTIVKSVSIILLGLFFSGGIIAAQEQTQADKPKQANQMLKPVLTEEQRTMLKNDLQKVNTSFFNLSVGYIFGI